MTDEPIQFDGAHIEIESNWPDECPGEHIREWLNLKDSDLTTTIEMEMTYVSPQLKVFFDLLEAYRQWLIQVEKARWN